MIMCLLSAIPLYAQPAATDAWTASVTTMAPTVYVRVSGDQLGRKTGMLHAVDAGQISVAAPQGVVRFERAQVQTVELVRGNPRAKERGMGKGLLIGAAIAAIGTINTLVSPSEMSGGMYAAFYGVTIGGGTGLGYLMSEKADYIVVYRRR